nr:MAG TPA: hypothetical protein [Caudoviricetes sp.]
MVILRDTGSTKALVRPSSLIGWWFFFTFEILKKREWAEKLFLLILFVPLHTKRRLIWSLDLIGGVGSLPY